MRWPGGDDVGLAGEVGEDDLELAAVAGVDDAGEGGDAAEGEAAAIFDEGAVGGGKLEGETGADGLGGAGIADGRKGDGLGGEEIGGEIAEGADVGVAGSWAEGTRRCILTVGPEAVAWLAGPERSAGMGHSEEEEFRGGRHSPVIYGEAVASGGIEASSDMVGLASERANQGEEPAMLFYVRRGKASRRW